MKKIVFFDLETSGLDKENHAIVQIGAIAFDVETFKEIERIDIPIKFRFETASPKALAINSVARGMILGSDMSMDSETMPELASNEPLKYEALHTAVQVWNRSSVNPREAIDRFSSFLKRHATVHKLSKAGNMYSVAQLAGHNVTDFDMPFLRAWYKRLSQFMPANWFAMDTLTMALANQAIGGVDYADLKLETLLRHHGVAELQEHDALADVAQTAALCQMLYHRIGFDNDIEAKKNEASERAQSIIDGLPESVRQEIGV